MSRQIIHPSIWSCPELTRLPLELHLAYLYLLPLADHWGRFEWDPLKIWQDVGEPRKLSQARLDKWLSELWDQGIIGRYETDGKQLAWFTVYEGLSAGRRYKPRYPEPTQATLVPRTGTTVPELGTPQEPPPPTQTSPARQTRPQSWLQEASGLSGGLPQDQIKEEFALISRMTDTSTRELLPVWAHYCGRVKKPTLGEFRTHIVRWMESWQESREEGK